ncbi:1-acyl-sn-glycerol-3-phosphate acyltransferase [Deinococcus sp. AJ005]|uniref:lysophospholipid acyltransferase family protein n=1 Tax=Deinococcus sp. AJ005 TaxID=2652443 RepID=UPI00125CC4CF|nr:1-acyl-sn-glycerol-3-phosphate acyltransferase [Deinococcus sp. AJ005]
MSDAARPDLSGSSSKRGGGPQTATPEAAPPAADPRVYRAVLAVTYLPVMLSGAHLEVHGREHVPPPGTPLVIAANHRSNLDPFMVARSLPPGRLVQFMAKKELFVPVIGWIISTGGSFPIDRSGNDLGAVRMAVRILKNNGTVGIFPQGTRGGPALQGGVALIAAKARAPILPAGICREGKRWIVRFGPPIEAQGGIKGVTAELGERLRELTQPVGEPV